MPRIVVLSAELLALISGQDGVIYRQQALTAGMTVGSITSRLRSGHWRRLLPEVYLTNSGEPTFRQRLVAALLHVGADSAIDGSSSCRFHRIESVSTPNDHVFVVAPFGSPARSIGFVTVRRTIAPITMCSTQYVRYVDAPTAAIAATRRMRRPQPVLATLGEVLQRRIASYEDLLRAHIQGPPRNARFADDALEQLAAGVRSPSEADFRALAMTSTILPELEYNVWLRLRCGRVVCVDALIESSAVVHETNGRRYHEREDLFADMQDRHDALTASGLVALHNIPARISQRGREVIAQVERTHLIYDGRGMPDGVERLDGPPGLPSALAVAG